MNTEDTDADGADESLLSVLSRLASDLVLLRHKSMDRPVPKDRQPYLRAGLALTAELALQTLQDLLVSEGEDLEPDGVMVLDDDLLAHDTRVFRAWHILETVGRRPWIARGAFGPESLSRFSWARQVGSEADQAMDDLMGLETSELNQLHTKVVLIDEGQSL